MHTRHLLIAAACLIGSLATADKTAAQPSSEAVIQELQDRVAIENLMWDYVRATDSLNPEAFAATFTPDGRFVDIVVGELKGRPALHKMIADIAASQAERRASGALKDYMHHFMSNRRIEFLGPDRARVHYYWQTVFAGRELGSAPPRVFAAGLGVDEVVRWEGKWLIESRRIGVDY